MSLKTSNTISNLLSSARLAFKNALNFPDILERVSEYGFDTERLQRSMQIHEEAFQATETQEGAVGDKEDHTAKTNKARMAAWDLYQSLAKVARAIFLRQPANLTKLELQGRMPRTTHGFLKRAYTLFDNALAMPELQAALLEYGYDEARLTEQRAIIAAYEEADHLQEAAKGTSQQATVVQNRALARLRDEYAQFRKIARVALRENPQLLEKLGIPKLNRRRKAKTAEPSPF